MIIKNGSVLNSNFEFEPLDISVKDNIIEEIGNLEEATDIDASGCYVIPGLVDTHMHGALGKNFIDFDPQTFRTIAVFEAKNGTTSLVPALSAAPKSKLLSCIENIKECYKNSDPDTAKIYGFHLEGPFFAEKYKGAHLPENIRNTSPDELMEYITAAEGLMKIITLAPELPDADETIKKAVEHGICVSIGHTNASYAEVCHAVSLGASQGTHLFNAMRPLNHRDPGTAGGILLTNAKAELIADFFHVHKDVVKMVYDLKGSDKINIITDSEVGTGFPDGVYSVNGRQLTVKDGETYTEDGAIAGGTSCLIDGVRNLVSIGISLEDAVKMATKNPAETAGIFDFVGSIEKNKVADLLILNKDLGLEHVILRGRLLF